MQPETTQFSRWRLLIIGSIVTALFIGLVLAASSIVNGRALQAGAVAESERVNVLFDSDNTCVECHSRTTPGIVHQYGHSTMAAAEVTCQDCHEVPADYPAAVAHEGTHVLNQPTTAMCGKCHQDQVAQFNQSRHALPAYVAYAGAQDLPDELLTMYEAIPEGSYNPDRMRNALFELEGPEITEFACKSCHDIGKPAADMSVGQCSDCHLRHEFSLEQVRKPETCNACHIGPDHPQWEIYQESKHGIAYATGGDHWHWDAESGTLYTTDFPAPTCATCHLSGFGTQATTHDVGDRLSWYLFAPISERRPAWQDNVTRMQGVCTECHNPNFIDDFYTNADAATERVNEWVRESNVILAAAKDYGLTTPDAFDEPIDFTHFNLWHHWGRTAKFGVWMQGADYVQWHGAYEILHDRAELIEQVNAKRVEAGLEEIEFGNDFFDYTPEE